MNIKNLDLIKENHKGKTYKADDFEVLYRNSGSISGDNSINKFEKIYLLSGEINLVIEDKEELIKSPALFEIPENTYHKIVAKTDVIIILYR